MRKVAQDRLKEDVLMSRTGLPEKSRPGFEFRFLLAIAFVIFLVAAVIARLVPRRWRWKVSGHDEGKSVFKTAWVAANNSIPFAFM